MDVSVLQKVLAAQLCLTLCDQWTIALQAPLSIEFFRQEHQSELAFPSAGDLPNPGIEPRHPALQADTFPPEPGGEALCYHYFTR